jgi:transketolase
MDKKIKSQDLKLMASSIRVLATDAVNKAKSGHIGTPLGAADIMVSLFANHMRINPNKPEWFNRDRFVLSVGHACTMLYSTLHFLGYKKMSLDAIKNLRQLGSITSGHPEIEHDAGVEVTTGPLGQGVSMAVGIAIAERNLSAMHKDVVNSMTYALVGDGCLMEGVSYEALSLAGNLGLSKLVVIYDKNNITIDGGVNLSSTEDVKKRMEAFGFNVLEINGHNYEEIDSAFFKAKENAKNTNKPTFIVCNTIIGYGVPSKEGKSSAHGFALTEDDIKQLKDSLNWKVGVFETPEEIKNIWQQVIKNKISDYSLWEESFNKYAKKQDLLDFISFDFSKAMIKKEIALDIEQLVKETIEKKPAHATRVASGKVLEVLCKHIPNFIGGSADLSGSNNTINKNSVAITNENHKGNYVYYGIREHGMAAVMNGIAAYGNGFIPYGGTFLVFSDYMRPAIRLSAIMHRQVIYVLTHDSIALGGDGPTHQPIEHIDSLRLIPNLEVIRPADLIETLETYEIALANINTPMALILGRGNVPTLRSNYDAKSNKVALGGYVLQEATNAVVNLISSGSELHIIKDAADLLAEKRINARVISMPSLNRFAKQADTYRSEVLGNLPNLVVEAKNIVGYKDILGPCTTYYGINEFGRSAESDDVLKHFGFTKEQVADFVVKNLKHMKISYFE